jgi:hypothetical protein
MLRNYTFATYSVRKVQIRRAGYEKQCGLKLPPHVMLNRKTITKNELFFTDVIVGIRNKMNR